MANTHNSLKEYPQKHIRAVAEECGIDLQGITIHIDLDSEKLKETWLNAGRADDEKVGLIEFYAKAFSSREELIRTIYHEVLHVRQFKEFTPKYVMNNRAEFERITEEAEDAFIERLKELKKL